MSGSDNGGLWKFPILTALAGSNGDTGDDDGDGPNLDPLPPGDDREPPEPPFREPDDTRDKVANELDHDELANLRTDNHHKKTTADELDHDKLKNIRSDNHHTKTTADEVSQDVRGDTTSPLFLEVRTSDPDNPAPGRIWYRSDLE